MRVYSKNTYRIFNLAINCGWGLSATSREGTKTFGELAACSRGIERIGVLRADVDSMGTALSAASSGMKLLLQTSINIYHLHTRPYPQLVNLLQILSQ